MAVGGHNRLTTEKFVERARIVHGTTYDYSETIYTFYKEKVKIICYQHGLFYQVARSHLDGCGCPECSNVGRWTFEKFCAQAFQIHGDFYDYSRVKVNGSFGKVEIGCPFHGVFYQDPHHHITMCQGCPTCKAPHGERYARSILELLNINYIPQWVDHDCRSKQTLKFDFMLPTYREILEINGQQHYTPVNHFGGWETFEKVLLRDNIKLSWCSNNGYRLIKIPYWYKTIENIRWFIENNITLS